MDILVGILLALVGLSLVFSGLRVFFFMLPIVGFVSGFFLGATLIANWIGDGFLATVTGWVVGLIIGVVFAILSYFYWYAGALLAAGSAGALLFSGIFSAFGISSGAILASLAIVGAILFIIGALVLNLPIYVVLVNTAIVGSYMVIGGILLMFNRADLEDYSWGAAYTAVQDNWFWWLVLVALSVAGIYSQLSFINRITLPNDKWTKIEAV